MHPKVTSGSAELIFRRTAEPSNTLDKEPEAAALLPHFDLASENHPGAELDSPSSRDGNALSRASAAFAASVTTGPVGERSLVRSDSESTPHRRLLIAIPVRFQAHPNR